MISSLVQLILALLMMWALVMFLLVSIIKALEGLIRIKVEVDFVWYHWVMGVIIHNGAVGISPLPMIIIYIWRVKNANQKEEKC